jgi:hypothetical protein
MCLNLINTRPVLKFKHRLHILSLECGKEGLDRNVGKFGKR